VAKKSPKKKPISTTLVLSIPMGEQLLSQAMAKRLSFDQLERH
jgi:hypothetical protein